MRTEKNDWLNNLLASSGAFVSGAPESSEILGLPRNVPVALRFVHFTRNNEDEVILYVLTVETGTQGNAALAEEKIYELATNPPEFIRKLASMLSPNFFVLLYFSDDPDSFVALDPEGGGPRTMSGAELRDAFAQFGDEVARDPGTGKQVNKTINDAFQTWTRQHLSRSCVVNDIDAFHLPENTQEKFVFFELKRVKEDLSTWEPYLDDYSNYRSLLAIQRAVEGNLRVLAYNLSSENLVAFHRIALKPNSIDGRRLLLRATDVVGRKLGKPYSSNRRRQ